MFLTVAPHPARRRSRSPSPPRGVGRGALSERHALTGEVALLPRTSFRARHGAVALWMHEINILLQLRASKDAGRSGQMPDVAATAVRKFGQICPCARKLRFESENQLSTGLTILKANC